MKNNTDNVTLRQIAQLARTSKSTVSRVLTNHPSVSRKTRERVEAVIQRKGFKPNLFARGLAGGRAGLIAVLTSEINSGFFAEVLKGVDEVVSRHDGHVLSSFAHGAEDYLTLWKGFSTRGRVDGVILAAPPMELLQQQIQPGEAPLVLCACRPSRLDHGWACVDTVTVDNDKGMRDILRHLTERGCKRLVHLAGPSNIWDACERRQSFERFLAEHPALQGETITISMTREDGRSATIERLRAGGGRPDAFVACNDLSALGALEALKEQGIRVPDEIAVTGFDDDPASSLIGLTTLHMPMEELGRESARLLFERLNIRENPPAHRDSVLEMTLCRRETSPCRAL